VEDVDVEQPQAGEVLIRIAACGVCHSDWHLMTGATRHPTPVVPGHEGAGVVEAVGPGVSRVKPGDHVILNWAPNCGHCFYCLRNKPSLCQTYVEPIWAGTMMDGTTRLRWKGRPVYVFSALGAFAEMAVVPQETCIPVGKDIPLKAASLVGCAVATGVGAVIRTAKVEPGSSVVVLGCGGVGLNILQGAALAGAEKIIAVDRSEAKMNLARQFGATHTLLANEHTLEAVKELTGGRGADYSFEAVGAAEVQEEAVAVARPGGVVVFVGLAPMGTNTNIPGAVLARTEKVVMGSYYGSVNTTRDFPLLIDLYLAGKLKLDELVTREYTLEQINEAYAHMLSGEAARGVVVF
jgi:S-(hydroxymethyl)glutathione dehydrogenase/alcohol dehydrogenase